MDKKNILLSLVWALALSLIVLSCVLTSCVENPSEENADKEKPKYRLSQYVIVKYQYNDNVDTIQLQLSDDDIHFYSIEMISDARLYIMHTNIHHTDKVIAAGVRSFQDVRTKHPLL